jgi:hypothetical protein
MRSSSLARVVITSLGVSVVITLGCSDPPTAPSPSESFSVLSISPSEGPTALATTALIAGTGFQSGDTVTVDGSRVNATVLSATAISLAMPAHAAGTVDVTVFRALPIGARSLSVRGGYRYAVIPPPVISELIPNTGSTAGGVPVTIKGTRVGSAVTVTVGGIESTFAAEWGPDDPIYLTMPAHGAGTVEVILTDRYGQTGRGLFTYASPATFDVNGDWEGWARLHVDVPSDSGARLLFTIRGNTVVSVSCSVCRPGESCFIVTGPSLTPEPPPEVANGEFSSAGNDVSITGKILSPIWAIGSIDTPSCGSRHWWADKKK